MALILILISFEFITYNCRRYWTHVQVLSPNGFSSDCVFHRFLFTLKKGHISETSVFKKHLTLLKYIFHYINRTADTFQVPRIMHQWTFRSSFNYLSKMESMANVRQSLSKIQMRWQRGPFESGGFHENDEFGEKTTMAKICQNSSDIAKESLRN